MEADVKKEYTLKVSEEEWTTLQACITVAIAAFHKAGSLHIMHLSLDELHKAQELNEAMQNLEELDR